MPKNTGAGKSLLLGGAGFLGQGLAKELVRRGRDFEIVDINDMDLSDQACIGDLAAIIPGFSHVFLLASRIGANLFESDPYPSGKINRQIYDNVMSAMLRSGARGLRFFYYSTSEVYWSMPSPDVYIGKDTVPGENIDTENPRSVYALEKLYAERNLAERMRFFRTGDFQAVTVIRPFNVFGPGQRRGVMYSMVKSCANEGVIRYSEDTTRTLTRLSYISRETADMIDGHGFSAVNMSDGFSTDMETLAIAVGRFMQWKFNLPSPKLEKLPPDRSIRYRQASPVVRDPDAVFGALSEYSDMNGLAVEIMKESGK